MRIKMKNNFLNPIIKKLVTTLIFLVSFYDKWHCINI